jgi:protein-S-isoprenylcysteine O-methyltransferase Ste14
MQVNTNINMKKLLMTVLIRYIGSFLVIGCILFIPAGTIYYWNGWILMGAFFIPMIFVFFYLITKDPELLEKRMRMRENQSEQKHIQKIFILLMLVEFVIPGLDYRFQWSSVPLWLVIVSTVLVVTGYILVFNVMKQNSYASRVIEIQDKQKIIDTGFYSVVRHPMYSFMLIIYIFSPLVLGSYYAVIPALTFPFMLAYRIKNEEEVLMQGLDGYKDYIKRVRYRLIPFIW